MLVLMLALLVFAIAAAAAVVATELRRARRASTLQAMLALFAPALVRAEEDPRQLLIWYRVAEVTRRLFPDAFDDLDRENRGPFPFGHDQLDAAHAKWTADWLAWERAHDDEYRMKAGSAERDISQGDATGRARLAAIEREKLERYQQRYEEYVRTAKALAALGERK